jgi:beta-galactosidase
MKYNKISNLTQYGRRRERKRFRRIYSIPPPAAIRLSADRAAICKCDDLSYVTVEVVDEKGNVVKYADNMIDFAVSGAGALQAAGNANPANEENYFGNRHSVHEGRGMAVLRSGCEAGSITLKAESAGLRGAEITVAVGV